MSELQRAMALSGALPEEAPAPTAGPFLGHRYDYRPHTRAPWERAVVRTLKWEAAWISVTIVRQGSAVSLSGPNDGTWFRRRRLGGQ